MSFVCAKHDRYVPDGEECPYCEKPKVVIALKPSTTQFQGRFIGMTAEPLHARADGSPCLCGSPACPNPAKPPGET